jgi:hypothetical protein
MYTADMLDKEGKPILARATMTTEQADRLRNQERGGGHGTMSGTGSQDVLDQNETCQREYSIQAVPRVVVAAGCKGLWGGGTCWASVLSALDALSK